MKRTLTLLALAACLKADATQWLTYYVYSETEYVQGPWTRTDLLEGSEFKYLAPQAFEDLFGSQDAELVNKLLSRLKDKKPNLYEWTYDLAFQGDTIVLTSNGAIRDQNTVMNEITATLTLNSFNAVSLRSPDWQETWTIDDLTLPYFDLVSGPQQQLNTSEAGPLDTNSNTEHEHILETGASPAKGNDPLSVWLIVSCVLNIGLFGLLIMDRKRT